MMSNTSMLLLSQVVIALLMVLSCRVEPSGDDCDSEDCDDACIREGYLNGVCVRDECSCIGSADGDADGDGDGDAGTDSDADADSRSDADIDGDLDDADTDRAPVIGSFEMGPKGVDCDTHCGSLGLPCLGFGTVGTDCGVHGTDENCTIAGYWIYREESSRCYDAWGTCDACTLNYNVENAFCCHCGEP